jgi:hypothetical protein
MQPFKHTLASKLILTASMATAIMLSTLEANATDQGFPAIVACYPGEPSQHIVASVGGQLMNNSPNNEAQWIQCGVGQDSAFDSNDDLLVFYEDADSGPAGADGVYCFAEGIADDWSTSVSFGTVGACSTAGGCSGWGTSSWTGTGYLRFSNIWHGGTYFTDITCSIPEGFSAIRALTIDE